MTARSRTLIVVFVISSMAGAKAQTPTPLCEILRNPQQFAGKEVTVRAIYEYGFEWSHLFCLGCKTWARFGSNSQTTSTSGQRKLLSTSRKEPPSSA